MKFDRAVHWDRVYIKKGTEERTWYQAVPTTSLELINICNASLDASIIDVGGGDSLLVDHLLDLGYRDLTVLDISETAVEKTKKRLGTMADQVNWLVADAATFTPKATYDLWHDRAAFHFLTYEAEAQRYVETAQRHLKKGGHLIIGTFSEEGPDTCSGLAVKQYSKASLTERFKPYFEKIQCEYVDHITPSGMTQNFIFCLFKKK